MDIQSLLTQFGPTLTQTLTSKSGFTPSEAKSFLPGLLTKVVGLLQGGRLDPQSLIGGDASSVISKLDLPGLAKQAGIDRAKAEAGAHAVVPSFLSQLRSQPGGLDALLGAPSTGGARGLLDKAGKLLGR